MSDDVAPLRGDQGGALVLLLLVAAVLSASLTAALGDLGATVVDRTRAGAAADAAALAGLIGGAGEAVRIARLNDADLVSFEQDVGQVTVVVEVAGVTARARATDAP